MGFKCCVTNCKNNKKIVLHLLPADVERFKLWVNKLQRTDLLLKLKTEGLDKIRKTTRVCTSHFSEEMKFTDVRNRSNLKHDAYPDINLPENPVPEAVEYIEYLESEVPESTFEELEPAPEREITRSTMLRAIRKNSLKCQNTANYSLAMGERQAAHLLDQKDCFETKAKVHAWLDQFDTVLTDCDGVLWLDDEALEGAAETMNRLRQLGKRIYYVTNNSTKTRDEFTAKASRLGFNADKDEIISTAYLVANYLKLGGFTGKVYVVGSKGVAKELELAGIEHIGVGPDVHTAPTIGELVGTLKLDPEVNAVVIGFDEHFSYPKMLRAASYLGRTGCQFLATNTDERFPMAHRGVVVPGTGSIVRSIETAAGREALCLGKPNDYISKFLVENCGLQPERTLMIGDRCNTDILLGTRCGFHTLLVLTGVTQLNDIKEWSMSSKAEDHELLPDFYIQKLGDLLPYI